METFTSLNTPKENLIKVVKEKYGVHKPPPTQTPNTPTKDKSKFCSFHHDYGHTTENYIQLKQVIEKLIRDGHLKEHVSERQPDEKHKRVMKVITP